MWLPFYLIRSKLEKEKPDEILPLLRKRGIEATSDDLRLALDTYWVLSELSKPVGVPVADGEFDLRLRLQQGLVRVVEQIDRGYERALTMYTLAFYIGLAMVLASIYAALVADSTKAAAVLGGLGMADILASMIFRPAQEVQNSRGNLAQLQAAFFSWFNDVYNWNNYLLIVDRDADSRQAVPDFDRVRQVSDVQMRNIERMMGLIEAYCETRSMPVTLTPVKGAARKRATSERPSVPPLHPKSSTPEAEHPGE